MPQLCSIGAASARGFGLTEEAGGSVLSDDQFNLTTLLLPGNGTNGARNNTFLDSSTNNFTVTRNGNTTQGTFSPFSQTGWSNYFAGGGTYLSTPNSSTVYTNFGTADFCIECWVFPTSAPGEATLIANGPDGTTSGTFVLYLYRSGDIQLFYNTGAGVAVLGSGSASSPTINTWSHIALTRQSGTVRCFVNGVSKFSGTVSGNLGTASGTSTIGTRTGQTSSNSWPGNISNLRIVKNAAVYTAAFTPPTAPLTAISGTSLLTCQSNRFVDNSANAFALTVNGNVSVQPFSPFNPTAAYSAATVGGSAYFDGAGDYLTAPYNSAWDFGTGDFTVESWLYRTALGSGVIAASFTSSGNDGWSFEINSSNQITFYAESAYLATSTATIPANTWTHIAASRSGTTLRLFIDGALATTVTDSTSIAGFSGLLAISATSTGVAPFVGYQSNVRVVKGTAVYTSAFVPPTAPLTNITNTGFLLSCTNAGITDATAKNVLETVGNAQISTAQSKFGGSSMLFDGTGDYLTFPSSQNFAMGTGNFTFEGWVYATASDPVNATGIFQQGTSLFPASVSNTLAVSIRPVSATVRWHTYANNTFQDSTATVSLNTWYHFAFVRNGTTTTLYVNGSSVITVTSDTTNYTGTFFGIGSIYGTGAETNWEGYINDLRITKGYARYTANFTPPTAAFPLL